MPPDNARADDPASWLSNAKADLALARVDLPPGGIYEHLCFHAQQAAEKAMKAVMIHFGAGFPFTHDLQALLDLLSSHVSVPAGLSNAADLSPYAAITRYPGDMEPVTEQEYKEAVALAEMVVSWAESVVGGKT